MVHPVVRGTLRQRLAWSIIGPLWLLPGLTIYAYSVISGDETLNLGYGTIITLVGLLAVSAVVGFVASTLFLSPSVILEDTSMRMRMGVVETRTIPKADIIDVKIQRKSFGRWVLISVRSEDGPASIALPVPGDYDFPLLENSEFERDYTTIETWLASPSP